MRFLLNCLKSMELLYKSNLNFSIKNIHSASEIKTILELFNITLDNLKAKFYIQILK